MKNLKHTPAPWKITKFINPKILYWFSISGNNGDNVCKILRDDSDNLEQQTADAKLIASAPELLEALLKFKEKLNNIEEKGLSTNEIALLAGIEVLFETITEEAIKKATE